MKRRAVHAFVAAISFLLCTGPALAQTAGDTPGKVDARSGTEASKRPPSEKQLAQREKMKRCNADAKAGQLKGDARKQFMRDCLSNRPAGAQGGTER